MKYIDELDLTDKKVIVRVDYNVPIQNDNILDTKKIDDSLETIDYLINQNCSIIILSHFGRIKNEIDKSNNSLLPVFEYLKSLNKYKIKFCEEPMGYKLSKMAKNLKAQELLLVENTRFLDLNGGLESKNDIQLSMYWAGLADFYIDDAFGSMHRNHSSIIGIPKLLPHAAGLLVKKEIKNLNLIINSPEKPFVVIMGGSKLKDKIDLIYNLAEKADYILLGGGIANTFLKAYGIKIGSSLMSKESIEIAKSLMQEYPDKFILPKDVITSPKYSETIYEIKDINNIGEDDVIGDIGPKAIENYKKILLSAKTIFINGTVGIYEKKEFSNGTQEILNAISISKAKKIVGGGDAASATRRFKFENKVDFISTGGGATLKYIAFGKLPGLEVLSDEK